MATIVNTKLGEHRGKKRVWLEGQKLLREGYYPGMKYDLELKDSQVVLRVKEEGKFTISKRERNGRVVVVKFFWTRRSDGRVMHRRATGRQGWPAFRTVRVIGSQVLNAIGYCYKS